MTLNGFPALIPAVGSTSDKAFSREVGQRLRQARVHMKLSRTEAGKLIGQGQSSISNYENGIRLLDVQVALVFCRHWRLTLDWLYGGSTGGVRSDLFQRIIVEKAAPVSEPPPQERPFRPATSFTSPHQPARSRKTKTATKSRPSRTRSRKRP